MLLRSSLSPLRAEPLRHTLRVMLVVALLATILLTSPQPAQAASAAATIPTFSILEVDAGNTVTVQTHNFPANQTFTVRMGEFGTLAVGGTVVGTVDSGSGGSFQATFDIPAALKDDSRVAIRMDSPAGYFAYNWFHNVTATSTATPAPSSGFTGIPTFSISSVNADVDVTILTNNFPPNQTFTVRMGEFGTLGVGGIEVGQVDSGNGGSFSATFSIPEALKGRSRIAIRMDSPAGFFAYNWFYNSTGTAVTPTPGTATPVPSTGYTGFPTFTIQSVVVDDTVTVLSKNFPPNQTFTVRMGEFGTLGIGGTVVGTVDSGAGGDFNATFDIPDSLAGRSRIAIRMDSPAGYFAYNWFWNSTADVTVTATPGASVTPTPGTTATPVPGYSGFPTFSITAVERDATVTIRTNNLPPNQTFTVRMGKFGTLGVGGTEAGTFETGAGGTLDVTFDIPDSVKGLSQIAIRIDSPAGYFAYNWFWNSTYP